MRRHSFYRAGLFAGLLFMSQLLTSNISHANPEPEPSILDLILYAYTFSAAGLFFPTLGLLFWKRTTSAGAFWSIMLGGSSAIVWTIAGEPWELSGSYIGWPVSFITLVIVSLLTRHKSEENLEIA